MHDIGTQLKELRLHGMASAWKELLTQEGSSHDAAQASRWLMEHLLRAEYVQRAMASVRHQMKGRLPSSHYTVIWRALTLKAPRWTKSWFSS